MHISERPACALMSDALQASRDRVHRLLASVSMDLSCRSPSPTFVLLTNSVSTAELTSQRYNCLKWTVALGCYISALYFRWHYAACTALRACRILRTWRIVPVNWQLTPAHELTWKLNLGRSTHGFQMKHNMTGIQSQRCLRSAFSWNGKRVQGSICIIWSTADIWIQISGPC